MPKIKIILFLGIALTVTAVFFAVLLKNDTQSVGENVGAHSELKFLNYQPIPIPNFAKQYIRSQFPHFKFPRVKLTDGMEKYLLKEGKSIRPWSITLDFNGDKRKDWAGLLERKNEVLDVVIIYSKGGKYTHSILSENVGKNNGYIHVGIYPEKPGTVHGFPFDGLSEKDRTATLNYTGIQLMFFERSSVLYYWKNDEIHELWTSD